MKALSLDTFRRLGRYLWQFKLTAAGKYLVACGLISGAMGMYSLDMPIFRLFIALFAVGATAFCTGLLIRPRVRVEGALPEKTTAGQTVGAKLKLVNRSRLPAYDISLGFFGLSRSLRQPAPATTVSRVGSGEAVQIPVELRPLKRGLYALPDIRAYTTFPFNICRAGSSRHPLGPLLVVPDFHPLDDVDIPVGRRYQPGGIALTSDVGESPEYIGNREYRPGDPARRIDFRSWARLGKPVVREYEEEYYCRIALVLDTFVEPRAKIGPEGSPQLEAAVSLSAAVADALSRGEYIIDIFAAGPELHIFRAGRHTAHLENILEILACVDACRSNPFELVTPALCDELDRLSTVICVFLDWDASREALCREAVEAGCAVKVFVVRDGATTSPTARAEEWVGPVSVFSPEEVSGGSLEAL